MIGQRELIGQSVRGTLTMAEVGKDLKQGLYRSWKTWKVMEFKHFIFQAWKVMEFNSRSLKVMEN